MMKNKNHLKNVTSLPILRNLITKKRIKLLLNKLVVGAIGGPQHNS
jgi:hypothetical protein